MANIVKAEFLKKLESFGPLHKLGRSQSLFEIGDGLARVYIRYSKIHGQGQTFFGLRAEDLSQLEGHPSFLCFLWDSQELPLLIPYGEYEPIFQSVTPANDGQYKARVLQQQSGDELYIAQAGRFSIDGNRGWKEIESLVDSSKSLTMPHLSHSQVQTLLGAIGKSKEYDIWIPSTDRNKLDWSVTGRFECVDRLPSGFETIKNVVEQIDVIWIKPGSNVITDLFEVEHSTRMRGALLRFNDIHLSTQSSNPSFNIVSKDAQKSLFATQLMRPTFRASGLNKLCKFLNYENVFSWHYRLHTSSIAP